MRSASSTVSGSSRARRAIFRSDGQPSPEDESSIRRHTIVPPGRTCVRYLTTARSFAEVSPTYHICSTSSAKSQCDRAVAVRKALAIRGDGERRTNDAVIAALSESDAIAHDHASPASATSPAASPTPDTTEKKTHDGARPKN